MKVVRRSYAADFTSSTIPSAEGDHKGLWRICRKLIHVIIKPSCLLSAESLKGGIKVELNSFMEL